jgi:hypothetical protein
MRSLAVLMVVACGFGCGQHSSDDPPLTPPAGEETVVAHLSLTVDVTDPPVKAAEVWLLRTPQGDIVRFDASWWDDAFRQNPDGPHMELQRTEHLSGFFRDSNGWGVSPFSDDVVYLDLHSNMDDHNLILQLRPGGGSTWGIATDFGDTRIGTVEVLSIEWDGLED